MRLWIKDPLAILAPDADRGIVVDGSKIVECVPRGLTPAQPWEATFDASRHVVLPGLINAHHHFYQTLTRAHPAGFGQAAAESRDAPDLTSQADLAERDRI